MLIHKLEIMNKREKDVYQSDCSEEIVYQDFKEVAVRTDSDVLF